MIPVLAFSQSQNQNYTKVVTYKKPTTAGSVDVSNPSDAFQQVVYFDGLGKPIQQVVHKQSNSGGDVITHIEYDDFGRQAKEYLPYTNQTGSLNYNASAGNDVLGYYNTPAYGNTTNPYSEKQLELSPLDRVYEQGAPGEDWALGNHSIKFDYQTNGEDEVKFYKALLVWNETYKLYQPALENASETTYYTPNQLYKTITKDENNITVEEFKDKEGRVVLKRTYNYQEPHDTYYVYDIYGNLTYVIPPLTDTSNEISITVLDGLCYQYKYDNRNRLAAKKLPGKQWEFIVYDKLDRVVATGPVFSPFPENEDTGWMISKYDMFGRVVYTGWYTDNSISETQRKSLQDVYDNATANSEIKTAGNTIDNINVNYSNTIFPTSGFKLLTVNYYDNYNYPGVPSIPSSIENQNVLQNVKGLSTGVWDRVLTGGSESNGNLKTNIYDTKSRIIRNYEKNYLGGYTQISSTLDFSGKTLTTETRQKFNAAASELVVTDNFEYSDQDRLLLHTQQLNGGTEQLIATNTFDNLGQLISKNVGGLYSTGATGLQKVDYAYNIRGWLKSINDIDDMATDNDFFAFKINYNTVESLPRGMEGIARALYNGNISETLWKSKSDNIERKYSYLYDQLNRLTAATYQKPGSTNPFPSSYNESLDYDKNGNILRLYRNGDQDSNQTYVSAINIDYLEYTYDQDIPNRLVKVIDYSGDARGFSDDSNGIEDPDKDYEYDMNGNLIADSNKNISMIKYNHLNLPIHIESGIDEINYLYSATGQKYQKKILNNSNTILSATINYLNGFHYKDDVLQFFPHPEGYVNVTNISGTLYYNYVFNYTDHLGNIRLSYGEDPSTHILKIMEENHYYPFGLKHTNYNSDILLYQKGETNGVVLMGRPPIEIEPMQLKYLYKYKYNGKELQDELGLNMYDYGARFYDPAVGRFWQMDPLAETSRRFSPYSYALNNPIYFIDRDGMYADVRNLEQGSEGTEECCPGLPFGNNPPKNSSPVGSTMQNFTPSSETTKIFDEGVALLKDVFGYEASGEIGESVAIEGTVGPVKVGAEATAVSATVESNKENIVEANVEAISVKLSGKVGTAEGSVSGKAGSAKVAVSKNGKVSASAEGVKTSASGTLGSKNKLSLSNSGTLALSIKVPTPDGVSAKLGVSANLYNAAAGTAKLLQGAISYFGDVASNYFSWP